MLNALSISSSVAKRYKADTFFIEPPLVQSETAATIGFLTATGKLHGSRLHYLVAQVREIPERETNSNHLCVDLHNVGIFVFASEARQITDWLSPLRV